MFRCADRLFHVLRNLFVVHAHPRNSQLLGEPGPRVRQRTVTTRDAVLTGKNASFSRKSRFEEEHFKIEFADRRLRRIVLFRSLRSIIFLAFSDPLVDVCLPLHALADFLESMFGSESISLYVVQVQFVRHRPVRFRQIVLICDVLDGNFNPIESPTQAFYGCRIKEVYRIIEEEVINGAGDSYGVSAQLRFLQTSGHEEVLKIVDKRFLLVVQPDEVRWGHASFHYTRVNRFDDLLFQKMFVCS